MRLLPVLLEACHQVLTPNPVFLLITAYAVKASSLTLGYCALFPDERSCRQYLHG